MMTTTTTAILSQDFASHLTLNSFEVLNDIEIELEGIFVHDFEQAPLFDINPSV